MDLVEWCRRSGYRVEPDGRDHWKVRDSSGVGVFRVTQRPGERPLWVSWDGSGGGDAVDLVRHVSPGTSYADAVYQLAGGVAVVPPVSSPPPPRHPPVVPRGTDADRRAGREYLLSRGLDADTLDVAERAGALLYTHGAVLLVGRDESGAVQNVIRRGYLPDDPNPKRSLAGSDTSYAVVLPGDPARLTVAEGPVTGLAVQALARLRGQPVPTVIVTGGVAMRRWVRRAATRLLGATEIVIAGERENDLARQIATDTARQRLIQEIRDVTGRDVEISYPPRGCGDAADELAAVRRAEEERRLEEERRQKAEAERQRQAEEERRRAAEAEMLRQIEEEAIRRAEAAARRRQAEEEARQRAEAERRRQVEEQRRRATPEGRRQAILEEEMRSAEAQLAQARTSWEREAVEAAARMRAGDRWRAEGIAPKEPRYTRRREHDEHWEPPAPKF